MDESKGKPSDFAKETVFHGKEDIANILRKFKEWFHMNFQHQRMNLRHFYLGEVCPSREGLTEGTQVIVSVIEGWTNGKDKFEYGGESFPFIFKDKFEYCGERIPVIYKSWKEIHSPPETSGCDHERLKEINEYLKANAVSMFKNYSNIELIQASPFKIKGSAEGKKTIPEPCIAIYCSYKGVVPVGENVFPSTLDGFQTDIREGFFHLYGNYDICANSNDHLDPLRMGASISMTEEIYGKGTLGGFVQLNDGKTGFITCAHVLHTDDQMIRNKSNRNKPVVQPPVGNEGSQICGNILRAAFPGIHDINGVSVDAAVVKLTTRTPQEALFADLTTARLQTLGFSKGRLPKFCCGKIRSGEEAQSRQSENVLKCGMKSGLTLGKLEGGYAFGRHRNIVPVHDDQQDPTTFLSQLTIRGKGEKPFAEPGDSGSLVFQYSDVHHLKCIGMVVAESGGYIIATPIESVLEALGVTLKDF